MAVLEVEIKVLRIVFKMSLRGGGAWETGQSLP